MAASMATEGAALLQGRGSRLASQKQNSQPTDGPHGRKSLVLFDHQEISHEFHLMDIIFSLQLHWSDHVLKHTV